MAVKLSVAARNASLDSFEAAVGEAPKLRIYSGTVPSTITGAATGTLLAELELPADWMEPAVNGSKTKKGTWSTDFALAAGIAGYYRLLNNGASVTHEQGSISDPNGTGDMKLDNTNIAEGQQVVVAVYVRNAGNA